MKVKIRTESKSEWKSTESKSEWKSKLDRVPLLWNKWVSFNQSIKKSNKWENDVIFFFGGGKKKNLIQSFCHIT